MCVLSYLLNFNKGYFQSDFKSSIKDPPVRTLFFDEEYSNEWSQPAALEQSVLSVFSIWYLVLYFATIPMALMTTNHRCRIKI